MAKMFITEGEGSQQTLSDIQNEKIPIYDTEQDAESDLANLAEDQIFFTKEDKFDVDDMKQYIRNQNVLSDWEAFTLSSDVSNPTVMQYDGFYTITYYTTQNTGTIPNFYVNGVFFTKGFTGGGNYNVDTNEILIPFKKGDSIYMTNRNYGTLEAELICYYKLRDYTDR